MRVAVCARACFEYGKERDSVGWKGGGGEDPHTDAKLAAVRHSCSSALLCSLSVVDFLSARRVFCGAGSAGRVRGSQTRRLPLRLQLPHDCRVHPPAGACAPARGSTLCLSPFVSSSTIHDLWRLLALLPRPARSLSLRPCQVCVAVLLDNFVESSSEMERERLAADLEHKMATGPVRQPFSIRDGRSRGACL